MTYRDFINQSFEFADSDLIEKGGNLFFHDVSMMEIASEYDTPLKLHYLPKIGQNIQKATRLFEGAMKDLHYDGTYTYCYCTKSSHFRFVVEEALKYKAHIETSSAFDLPIVRSLYEDGKLGLDTYIICNGFKRKDYTDGIIGLINNGFKNCIPILDNPNEIDVYENAIERPYDLGIRVAIDEQPNFEFYTSRLGMRYGDLRKYYLEKIKPLKKAGLKVLHFFVSTGIQDTPYFWGELDRFMERYCELKQVCPSLSILDLGGGFPIKNSLQFQFDYKHMVHQMVSIIKQTCESSGVPTPDIFTEFGNYTVGESGAVLYSVMEQKRQNDKELWYMIDGSFITHLPDSWGLSHKFILLPLNLWDNEYHKVNLGGITCDHMDYYNSEAHSQEVYLPKIKDGEKLFLGFFHTGAYQESLGGYGGIQHCLIPSPRHIVIDRNDRDVDIRVFREEEKPDTMLKILGYK